MIDLCMYASMYHLPPGPMHMKTILMVKSYYVLHMDWYLQSTLIIPISVCYYLELGSAITIYGERHSKQSHVRSMMSE